MLRGHARAKVDSKGRLKVPSEFLDSFLELCDEDRRVFVTSRDGRRALVYPLPIWEAHEKKILDLPSTQPAVERYVRATSFWGRECSIDASGRLLIHPLLRESASIDGAVSVFGKQQILEICDYEMFRHEPPAISGEDLAALAQFGI